MMRNKNYCSDFFKINFNESQPLINGYSDPAHSCYFNKKLVIKIVVNKES